MDWPRLGLLRRTRSTGPTRLRTTVLGLQIMRREMGSGRPVVFLNSALGAGLVWDKVLPLVADSGRCVAVDPIGFGASERPYLAASVDFDFDRQQVFFDNFMETEFGDEPVTLVLSGLASILGFHWARRHEEQVSAICHMESVFRPFMWPDLSEPVREMFKRARSEEGQHYVVDTDRYFAESLESHVLERPDPALASELLEMFGRTPQARIATFGMLRYFPINGFPADSHQAVQTYSDWLSTVPIPKLLILGEPGYLLTDRLESGVRKLTHQRVVTVKGKHVLPLDSPAGVGRFLAAWLKTEVR